MIYLLAGSIRSRVSNLRRKYGTLGVAISSIKDLLSETPANDERDVSAFMNYLMPGQLEAVTKHGIHHLPLAYILSIFVERAKHENTCMQSFMSELFSLSLEKDIKGSFDILDNLAACALSKAGHSLQLFCSMNLAAMNELKCAKKSPSLVYDFARCIAVKRPGTTTSLMPLDRMPFGLVQYQIEFFTSTHVNQV